MFDDEVNCLKNERPLTMITLKLDSLVNVTAAVLLREYELSVCSCDEPRGPAKFDSVIHQFDFEVELR